MPLSAAEALDVVHQIAEAGAARLVLSGADLRVRADLDAIVRAATDRGVEVMVALCGPAITRATMRRMAAAGARSVALAFDPPEGEDAMMSGGRRIAARARAAGDSGLALQIDTTVTGANVGGFPAVESVVASLSPALWHVRTGVARTGERRMLQPDDYEQLLHRLCAWCTRTGLAVHTSGAPAIHRVAFERARALAPAARKRARLAGAAWARPGLNDGKGMAFITHGGDVYPSDMLPCAAGNVRTRPLAEIYRAAPLFREIRAYWRLRGRCGVCPFYVVCGGSRARAHAVSGDLLGEDPSCGYLPPDWVAALK